MKKFILLLSLTLALVGCSLFPVEPEQPPDPSAARDPGVRAGAAGAGGPLAGLTATELAFFNTGKDDFAEVENVVDGLGPTMNLDSCVGCHAQPAVGGTSPAVNPQVAFATKMNATNVVPSFITSNGPVREVRFVRNPDGTPDGGVHDLFVISGRRDASGCNIKQPDFVGQLAKNNVVFRIPTPTFGLGLVESVPDNALQAVQSADRLLAGTLGISGEFNRSGNDGTITRFGWKAQNKSLLIFAGEAYNVEQGVTNELFPNERETDPSCQYNSSPEDYTNLASSSDSGSPASDYASDTVNFAAFMRLSAPPSPVPDITTALNSKGGVLFKNIGCVACHAIKQTTGRSGYAGQSNTDFYPFSDFALHDMGSGLADGVTQGNANGSEFRTAPLWGIGQRIFFLH